MAGQVQQQARQRLHVVRERRRPDDGKAPRVGPLRVGPLRYGPLRYGTEQPRLADARLARDEQQPAFPRRGAGQPVLDQGEERIPAD